MCYFLHCRETISMKNNVRFLPIFAHRHEKGHLIYIYLLELIFYITCVPNYGSIRREICLVNETAGNGEAAFNLFQHRDETEKQFILSFKWTRNFNDW